MLITDEVPAPNGTPNEKIGLVISKLTRFLGIKERQRIQSLKDLQAAVDETRTEINQSVQQLQDLVNAHANLRGAQHGETAKNVGLGRLNNWRSTVESDGLAPYSDQLYLTSDVAKKIANDLVQVDFDNFMTQGQLPLAYFEGGFYGALIHEFRVRIGYLKTALGFVNTLRDTTRLMRIAGNDDLTSVSYPMQSGKKISFLSNQDDYLITAPSDKYGVKDYPLDKYFLSTPIQNGFDPILQEITDQPYTIRNIGWGAGNQLVLSNIDKTKVYTLFNEDFYLGQDLPIEIKMASGENSHLNYINIPGSGLLGTANVAGSLQLTSDGLNIFLGGSSYLYNNAVDISITIDDTVTWDMNFVSPVDPSRTTPIGRNAAGNLLGINGLANNLKVKRSDNQMLDLIVGKAGKGTNIPWDNLIDFQGNDKLVEVVDFSDVDPFFNYGTLEWEFENKTLIGYIDGVIKFINRGNPIYAVFRCGLRISLIDAINVELLDGVVPSVFNNGISGGTTLFPLDESSPFHPVYGRGAFLGFGGHVSGMTRETDIVMNITEHQFTSVSDYARGYWNTPVIVRSSYPNYPAERVSVINPAPRRIVPIMGTSSLTQMYILGPKSTGVIEPEVYVWNGIKAIYDTNDSTGQRLMRTPTGTNEDLVDISLPKATLAVMSQALGVNFSSLVYSDQFTDGGVDYYTVTNALNPGVTWSLDSTLRTLFENIKNSFSASAIKRYNALNKSFDSTAFNPHWTFVIEPTGTSAATVAKGHLVVSDGCGEIGYASVSLIPNSTTKSFTSNDSLNAITGKMVFGDSKNPNFDQDAVDSGYEYYDVSLFKDTSKNYLHLSRIFGSKHGGCVINLTDNTFVHVDDPQFEGRAYPVTNDFILNYLPIPGAGCFFMSDFVDGLMINGSNTIKLDVYGDETAATIVDSDGVTKYQYVVPEGTSFIVAGRQLVLDQAVSCLFDASKQCYLYLSLDINGIVLIASETVRQPTIYEVLYGRGSLGQIAMSTSPYCVITDRLFSEAVVGSGVPMTLGDVTTAGSSNWKLK